jgi:putative ABC transport system permease protein
MRVWPLQPAHVAQSSRQLALRMALGADASHVRRFVLTRGLAMTVVGTAIGVAFAFQTTRLMGYLLYQVSPRDPSAFAAAVAVVTLAALAACLVPARHAARTDPIQALRA